MHQPPYPVSREGSYPPAWAGKAGRAGSGWGLRVREGSRSKPLFRGQGTGLGPPAPIMNQRQLGRQLASGSPSPGAAVTI